MSIERLGAPDGHKARSSGTNPEGSGPPEVRPSDPWITWRGAAKLALVLAVLVTINQTLGAYLEALEYELGPEGALAMQWGLVIACLVYGLLLAIPFVPGVEIGVGLLAMFGASVALHVYVATVLGLTLAYTVGRHVPLHILAQAARRAGMTRTTALLDALAPLDVEARVALLVASAPNRWARLALRNRLLAVAILLNLPGNVLIGGGGGIALVSGLIGICRPLTFVAVVAVAVAPVPLMVAVLGKSAIFG